MLVFELVCVAILKQHSFTTSLYMGYIFPIWQSIIFEFPSQTPNSLGQPSEAENAKIPFQKYLSNSDSPSCHHNPINTTHNVYFSNLSLFPECLSIWEVSCFISFSYCSRSGVLVVSPSGCWYRPPVAGIALPSLVSPSSQVYIPNSDRLAGEWDKIVTTPLVG